MLLPFCKFAFLFAGALSGIGAFGATVNIAVADRSGKPLADAVVMLAPVSGHLPVRPMTGVEIAQTHRHFSPQVSVVTVGTAISFPNLDTVRHHVYSFSAVKIFELKLYAGVPASPVVFDKPGIAVLGCNIHDDMVGWVIVVDTPLFARSVAGGKAQIEGVPPGSYTLRVWHPELADATVPLMLPLVVDAEKVEAHAALVTNGGRR